MCLALCAQKGRSIPFSVLQEGFKSNPHGAGYAIAKPEVDGTTDIFKGFFTFGDFWEEFKEVNGKYDLLVHFRYSTGGARNEENCHPWQIDDKHAMIHNGTLKSYTRIHNGLSDTGNFNEQILKPLVQWHPDLIGTPYFNALAGQAIGEGNKMAILNGEGKIYIFNEHLGNYLPNGVWASNFDYIRAKKRKKKVVCAVC